MPRKVDAVLDRGHAGEAARNQADPVVGLPVAAHGELAVHTPGHVVVGLAGDLGVGNRFEVEGVEHLAQRRNTAVIAERMPAGCGAAANRPETRPARGIPSGGSQRN